MRYIKFPVVILLCALVIGAQSQSRTERRERARAKVIAQIENAWRQSGTEESLRLIVIVAGDAREGRRVFPRGVRHLPETLTPRVIYCCDPECTRSVQYVGKARRDGFTFAVFRRWGGDWRE